MKNKILNTCIAATLLGLASVSAQAVTLSISTSTPLVKVGDTIELLVSMDFFDDATVGGGFDINFDPSLVSYVFNSYITDPLLGSDPFFTRDDNPLVIDPTKQVEILADRLAGAAFGNFAGIAGPLPVGPLSFTADVAGTAVFSLGASTSTAVGGFFSAATSTEQFPIFNVTTVNVVPVPAIPVPAAVWLFGSGLLGLIGIARRRTA